jgi:hypothetical protein
MLRKILAGLAIFFLLLIVAGALFYHFEIKPTLRRLGERSETQRKMLQPRVIEAAGKFGRRVFYAGSGLGNISQIRVGWPADREGADIAVVAAQGADFIDRTGQVKKQVRFSIEQRCAVTVARIDSAGDYGYLTRDESWAVPATLFDNAGHVSWRSGRSFSGVDDSAPGDVSGNGKLSVAIGFNGGGGLTLLDGQGKTIWQKPESNVWHLETLDTTGDGHEKILQSNAKGQLLVRDEKGNVVAQYLSGFNISHFALTRWGDETRPSHILVPVSEVRDGCCKPALIVLDAGGKQIAEMDSPLGDLFTRISATSIRFNKDAQYFAVLKSEPWLQRSMLLLYGGDGHISYQEILGEACLGIAALPMQDGEHLLVGCTDKIWEYSPVLPTNPGDR